MEWENVMDNLKISLDIRTILAQLNIEFEKFTEWEEEKQVGFWEDTEWLECSDDSDSDVAV
jgi:hypothetical protein